MDNLLKISKWLNEYGIYALIGLVLIIVGYWANKASKSASIKVTGGHGNKISGNKSYGRPVVEKKGVQIMKLPKMNPLNKKVEEDFGGEKNNIYIGDCAFMTTGPIDKPFIQLDGIKGAKVERNISAGAPLLEATNIEDSEVVDNLSV